LTDSRIDVRRYALRLLSYRARSENELRERLLGKGFPEGAVSSTLLYLKEAGFIDDAALAQDLKRLALGQKKLGYSAARSFMQRRGLPRDLVEATLGYDEEVELGNARNLLEKRLKCAGSHLTAKEKKRLYDYLSRRGFSFSVINKAMRDFEQDEGDEE
jgi:regulatory protein